jgi:small-conductance mechanosensitive channel
LNDILYKTENFRWAVALVVGFPVVMLAMGETVIRLRRRGKPIAATLSIVRNLVLPVLALLILMTKIIGLSAEERAVHVVETLLWIFILHAGLSFINDVVFAGARADSWQSRVPKLLIDLVRLILVLLGGAMVLSWVWEANLASVVTALGVGSIVLGLALQEPLGNVFSGIMLMFERPFVLADWIRFGGTLGKVVEINWRAVHLETLDEEVLIVPNSELSKGSFTNLSRPSRNHEERIDLCFSQDDPPNAVKRVLVDTATAIDGVLPTPAPHVETQAYKDYSIEYRLNIMVADPESAERIRDEFLTRIWYAARREGLTMPYPIRQIIRSTADEWTSRLARDPLEDLKAFPQFLPTSREDSADPAPRLSIKNYARGERIDEPRERLSGLWLILNGTAGLSVLDRDGREQEFARVTRGEYIGGGESADVLMTALEDLDLLILDPDTLASLLERTPRLARELGTVLDLRRKAASAARGITSAHLNGKHANHQG